MDRLAGMGVFVAVADAGSLTKAAQRLGLSAPAVTRSLAALELRLGARLFHRTTRSLRLTEQGQRYLEDCRRILAEVEEAEDALRGEHSAPQGTLHLTAPVLFGELFVMPAVRDFLDDYPGVKARVLLLDRIVNLVDEGLDLGVRLGQLADSPLMATTVGQVRVVVCASPSYLAISGRPQTPEDLEHHKVIATEREGSRWRFRDRTAQVQPRLVVNSNQAAIEAAVAGWGVTRLLSYQVAEAVASGALEIVMENHEREPWPVHVVSHAGRMSLKVRLFQEFLVTRLRAELLGLPRSLA